MARNVINEIIPGKLYQRGNIFTWQKSKKDVVLDNLGIDVIVNFWPKLDSNIEDRWVLHLATNASKDMLTADIDTAAVFVADLLDIDKTVLVLCEAGKTRSVYFCVLVASYYLDVSLPDALEYVENAFSNHRLKGFMLDHICGK